MLSNSSKYRIFFIFAKFCGTSLKLVPVLAAALSLNNSCKKPRHATPPFKMGVNPVLSIFFAICILALFLPTASAADNCNEKFDKNQKLTYDEVQEVIECELKNTERIEKLVRELLKKIDFEKEFKNITGVT